MRRAVLLAAAMGGAGGAGGLLACGLGSENEDGFAPLIEITSPEAGIVGGLVEFSANAQDETAIAVVRFFVDNVILFQDTQAPYTTTWDTRPLAEGSVHSLRAEAEDPSGNKASEGITVTVQNAAN